MRAPVLLLTGAFLLAACGGEAPETPAVTGSGTAAPSGASSSPAPGNSSKAQPTAVVGTVATGLSVPWGIAFLPDGSALVTERDSGRVLRIQDRRVSQVGTVTPAAEGEAGLLGIAVSPDFADNQRVFVYVTTEEDNRVVRMRLRDGRLGDQEPVLTGIPKGFIHDGGRVEFADDGALWVSTGETGERELAQDEDSLAGKILRIDENGDPAPGNPDQDSPIYSLGHRNVQGIAFDDGGNAWASEFGDSSWDELNLVRAGENYGWPRFEGARTEKGYAGPAAVWRTDDASPSGLAFADGSLWMAALRGGRLWQIPLDGTSAGKPVAHLTGTYGRLRTVVRAPDGNLWLATSNRDGRGEPKQGDDKILIVRP